MILLNDSWVLALRRRETTTGLLFDNIRVAMIRPGQVLFKMVHLTSNETINHMSDVFVQNVHIRAVNDYIGLAYCKFNLILISFHYSFNGNRRRSGRRRAQQSTLVARL